MLDEFEIPFRVMHGYASATAVYDVARQTLGDPQPLTVFYVGDWDPSGLHMSEEDLPARLHTYRATECEQRGISWWRDERFEATTVTLLRLALRADDVGDALPSFDAATKRADPRWSWYVARYGRLCWELDALSPVVLRHRVRAAVQAEIDATAWQRYAEAEALERESIASAVGSWRSILMPATE